MNASSLSQAVRAAALGLLVAAPLAVTSAAAAVSVPTDGAVVARVAPEPATTDSPTSCGGGRLNVACAAQAAVAPTIVVPHEAAAALSAEVMTQAPSGASPESQRAMARARHHGSTSVPVPHAASAALGSELVG